MSKTLLVSNIGVKQIKIKKKTVFPTKQRRTTSQSKKQNPVGVGWCQTEKNEGSKRVKTAKKYRKSLKIKEFTAFLVAGVGFEPHDLRVMSPTSYQAALPRDMMVPEAGVEPVRDKISRDFKSRASAYSAIPA